nr:MAG: hypothetical protein [Apis mellifra filamentous-like virus]
MGFIGSLRKFVRNAKDSSGAINTVKVSESVVSEAKRLNLNNLTNMFSTTHVKTVDNKALFGTMELSEFVRVSRLGDYNNSFKKALANTTLLQNSAVERSVKKVLADAVSELPDAKLAKNVENVAATKKNLNIPDATNVDELSAAVNANPKLKAQVEKLTRQVSNNPGRALKFFGYSVLLGAGAITTALILQKCVEEAAKASGCFYYYVEGGAVKKCKVSQLSCKTPNTNEANISCATEILPSEIVDATVCANDKETECHANCNTEKYDLPENSTLKCEHKSPGDILAEGISNTIGPVVGGITNTIQNIAKYLGIGLLVIFIIFILFYFFKR